MLVGIANQTKLPNSAAIGESEMPAIHFKLPSSGFVFHRPIIMLEFGIALLAWFVRLAVVIEAGDREPSTVATCLTSLRIETSGKGILFGDVVLSFFSCWFLPDVFPRLIW